MTKLSIALLTVALFAFAPLAMAHEHYTPVPPNPSEGEADCEEGQQWIGYTNTDFLRVFVNDLLGEDASVAVCEGEHWDGQDTVGPNAPGSRSSPCTTSDPTNAPNEIYFSNCQPADPSSGAPSLGAGIVGIRLSAVQDSGAQQVYLAVDIYGVGKSVTYIGHCDGTTGGLEGHACEGSQQGRVGIYIHDNSEQVFGDNVLATIVSALGITKGYPAEGDCSQTDYAFGANNNDRTICGRDNTAITAEALLP